MLLTLVLYSPLFSKEGLEEILQSGIQIPLYPPLQKGDLIIIRRL